MTKEGHLRKIKAADHAYYDLDDPIMADTEYDKLRNEYIEKYGSEDLDYVPGEAAADFEKFKHPRPVISLAKVKWETEKEKLRSEIERLWPVIHEPKLDGLTVVAYPDENGKCKFVTRGQGGLIGEVLPNFISDYEKNDVNMTGFPVRGEVFMEFSTLEEINGERKKEGLPLFANPRNAAAGILRNKERSPYLNQLRYIVYDILDEGDDTERQRLEKLIDCTNFEVVPFFCGDTVEDEIGMIEDFYINSSGRNVPVDGVVVKSNQAGSLKKWGSTNHHPRNAFAVKFQQEQVETVLRDVIWQVGRDSITPVAIMDPVELDGSVISRASLHNWANIQRLKLNKNDRVIIEKANEIIPQIVENKGHIVFDSLEANVEEMIPLIAFCPACGKALGTRPLKTKYDGIAERNQIELFCPNPRCDEKLAQQIAYLGSKKVLNIDGLSIETARKVLKHKTYGTMVKESGIYEIFNISAKGWEEMPGFAAQSAQKLYDNVQSSRNNVNLAHFVAACCIPGIGITVGTALMKKYKTLDALLSVMNQCKMAANAAEELMSIDGIGKETARVLLGQEFKERCNELKRYIVPRDYTETVNEEKVFVLTGKMEHPRSYYEALITKSGGKVAGSVTKNTNYLVIADVNSTSTKAKKARDLGTKLISPKELEEMFS